MAKAKKPAVKAKEKNETEALPKSANVSKGADPIATESEVEAVRQLTPEEVNGAIAAKHAEEESNKSQIPQGEKNEPDLTEGTEGPGPIETETESLANKDLVDEIVRLRLNADKALQLTSRFYNKTDNAVEGLFIAKAWMGKLLGETGSKNPYIVNKKIERPADIPKTANVYYLSFDERQAFDNLSEIDRVLSLRGDIDRLIQDLDAIDFIESVDDKRKASIAVTEAYVHLSQAKFELGNKLAKIREQ